MSLKFQSNFAAGELDPALHERTTLAKYSAGLKTGRNVWVGKTGRLLSKAGRRVLRKGKVDGSDIILWGMPQIGVLLEFGHNYVRVLDAIDGSEMDEFSTSYAESELDQLEFQNIGEQLVLITQRGQSSRLLFPLGDLLGYTGGFISNFFATPAPPTYVSFTASAAAAGPPMSAVPNGYPVDYAVTVVVNGQESLPLESASLQNKNACVGAGMTNTLVAQFTGDQLNTFYQAQQYQMGGSTDIRDAVYEFKVYRRPTVSGAYGYIGSTTAFTIIDGGNFPDEDVRATFSDIGQAADYTHQPPSASDEVRFRDGGTGGPEALGARVACMYQQRLLLGLFDKVLTSRTGYPWNFTKDFPINSDSALDLKIGIEGNAYVLKMIENDGLIVFSTRGVYLHTGAMTPSNVFMQKKGKWVIDERTPPISIPGGVLFVDKSTNTVRQFLFSEQASVYIAEELSIFNNHLFTGKRIKSWTFEEGETPILWAVFTDGTYASFTYERDHNMRAWTRHDAGTDIKFALFMPAVENDSYDTLDVGQTYFVVQKGEERWIEVSVPRYVSADILADNPEADKNHTIAAMDGMASWSRLLNDEGFVTSLVLTQDDPDDTAGIYTLTCNEGIFNLYGIDPLGAVGNVFRWFDPDDGASIDLEVTERVSPTVVKVQPSEAWPAAYLTDPRLYFTKDHFGDEFYYDLGTKLAGSGTANTVEVYTAGDWEGQLTMSASAALFTVGGNGDAGTLLYHSVVGGGGRFIILEVVSRVDDFQVIVQPWSLFPEADQNDLQLYEVDDDDHKPFFLDHLEGEEVAIVADGYVKASPNNTIDFPTATEVTDAEVTLDDSYKAAIVHIGRPYCMDIGTLAIDTVEQRPVLIESMTVNKVYIKVHQSRGLYVGARFPAGDSLSGMDDSGVHRVELNDLDSLPSDWDEDGEVDETDDSSEVVANRYPRPRTKRVEVILDGDWATNGQICIRQVDPVHFEILSILPDVEDQRREN